MDSKATTVLTNLQRGNIEAKIAATATLSFHEKCGQGKIKLNKFLKVNNKNWILGEIEDEDLRSVDDINQPDHENKFSPLHWSCHYGQLRTVEKLLKFGANPNVFANNHITPIHLAASGGHHEIVRLLIAKNANINQLDIDGNSALHFCAFANAPHTTNEILQSGLADLMKPNSDGKTPYHLAIENKSHLAQAVIENFISGTFSWNFFGELKNYWKICDN